MFAQDKCERSKGDASKGETHFPVNSKWPL